MRAWPPVWVCLDAERPQHMYGELGILKEVKRYETANSLFLVMEHDALPYMGCVLIDDQAFRKQMSDFLESCVGMTIPDIGDLNVNYRF